MLYLMAVEQNWRERTEIYPIYNHSTRIAGYEAECDWNGAWIQTERESGTLYLVTPLYQLVSNRSRFRENCDLVTTLIKTELDCLPEEST